MDNKYNFTSQPTPEIKNIRDWYKYQENYERERILSGSFCLISDVTVKTYHDYGKGLKDLGHGTCTLTRDGFSFKGYENGQEVEHFLSVSQMPPLLFGCSEDFELYINDVFHYFVPRENLKQCVRWALCSEELIKLNKENKLVNIKEDIKDKKIEVAKNNKNKPKNTKQKADAEK